MDSLPVDITIDGIRTKFPTEHMIKETGIVSSTYPASTYAVTSASVLEQMKEIASQIKRYPTDLICDSVVLEEVKKHLREKAALPHTHLPGTDLFMGMEVHVVETKAEAIVLLVQLEAKGKRVQVCLSR